MEPTTPFDLDEIERPTYLPEVLSRARRKFEYLYELDPGTSYQEWIDVHSLGVTGWADCKLLDFDVIHAERMHGH